MPIEVELPDGQIAEFPDGTPHEVMRSALMKISPPSESRVRENDVRSGQNTPDFRQGGFLPDRVQRFSDMVTDPIGLQDEIVGAGQAARNFVTSGGSWEEAKKGYTEGSERIKAERRVTLADNPSYVTIPAQIAGAVGTAGAPYAYGAATAARAVPGFVEGVTNSMKVGFGSGAVAGYAQGEGSIENRLLSGAKAGAVGGVAAPVIGNVLIPGAARVIGGIKSGAALASRAVEAARDPQGAALNRVADSMVAAGVRPADVAARVQAGGPTPMNIVDHAKDIAGPGASGPVTRLGRAAMSLGGDESAVAAGRLEDRQFVQPGRVNAAFRQSVGGADAEVTQAAGMKAVQDEAGPAYKAFYGEKPVLWPQLGDLAADPVFKKALQQGQHQARIEAIKANQAAQQTGGQLVPIPRIQDRPREITPQLLDYTQRQLRIAGEGVTDPNTARHAGNLREVLLDRMEQHFPTFRDIRAKYAQGQGEFGAEGALQAGKEMTKRLGEPARESLKDFDKYSPAQQELFRIGLSRKFMDDVAAKGEGTSVANQFNTGAVREIIEHVYPRSDAGLHARGQELLKTLREESITSATRNDLLKGSRTAELGQDMSNASQMAKTGADVLTGRWGRVVENLSTRLTTQIGQRGAGEVSRVLTETDPAQLLPTLARLHRSATSAAERRAYVVAMQEMRAAGAPVVSEAIGDEAGRDLAIKPKK